MRTRRRPFGIFTSLSALIAALPANAWVPNGIEIPASELPGVVSLHFTGEKDSFFCSGSIISQGTVLTAAHCAQGLKSYMQMAKKAAIQAAMNGSSEIAEQIMKSRPTIRSGNRTWPIDLVSAHPNSLREPVQTGKTRINGYRCPDGYKITSAMGAAYCLDSRNDVALFFTADAIKGTGAFPSSWILRLSADEPKIGDAVTMVGYGVNDMYVPSFTDAILPYIPPVITGQIARFFPKSTEPLMSTGSGIKRKGFNKIVDVEKELIFVTGLTQDKGSAFSPKPDGQNAATGSGDSGGPLLKDGKIIGVTSHGAMITSNDEKTSDSAFVRTDRKEIIDYITTSSAEAYQLIRNPQPQSVLRQSPP